MPRGLLPAGQLLVALTVSSLTIWAFGDEPEVNCFKLRPQATVYGQTVTLADVLLFAEADQRLVEQIADQPLVPESAGAQPTTVSHDQVVRRLDQLGVNLARVLIGGAAKCQITYAKAEPPDQPSDHSPLLRQAPVGQSEQRSLADLIRAQVDAELARMDGQAQLSFERAGQEFLQLTSPPWEFSISSADREKLGLRHFRVVIRRDGQVQRRAELLAQARLVRPAVVARRPLNPGNFVRREDVELQTRVFDTAAELGLARLEEAVGQQIKHFVASGQMVTREDLKPVDLVVRSRPVTLIGDGNHVQVRLTGLALDSGGYGDTVRVRLGDSRRERKTLRGVVTGLGTVRLTEGSL